MPESKVCERCGETYYRAQNLSRKQWEVRRFCGRKCSSAVTAAARTGPRSSGVCADCGELVAPIRESRCLPCLYAERYRQQRDHRLKVNREWREKNPDYWKADWHREAAIARSRERNFGGLWEAVMERDHSTCQDCGITSEPGAGGDCLCIHHIDGDHSRNDLSNLVVLCNRCHTRLHAKQGDYFGDGRWAKAS